MKKIAAIWTVVAMCLLVMCGTSGVVVGQDDEKPKPSANLDTKSIENTALYLNRATIKLQQLSAESERTGNRIKYNEYSAAIQDELNLWKPAKVAWVIQVQSVGETIKPIQTYQFKNKSQLTFAFARKPDLPSNFPKDKEIEFDLEWAKTLKRGDFMIVEGTLSEVRVREGIPPHIEINVSKLSKYLPPQKK